MPRKLSFIFWLLTSSSALWQGITNIGVLNNGTNADIVTTNISCAFLCATPENFLYDGDGNLTNDGRFVYTWDAENRLTSATSYTNASTASKRRLTFEYDWQGRRIRRGVCLWTNSNWLVISSNKFCYDGWNLIAELNATNNNLVRSYAWGLDVSGSMNGAGGVGGLLWVNDAVTLGSNSTHVVTYDGNGNVSSLVSAGNSAVTAKYEYGPFGDLIQASGPMARSNPIRFSSKYQDNETGLLYYGYRFYSPSLGRWLNRDPLEEPGGLNLYGFANGDAISWFDPSGMDPSTASLFFGNVKRNGLSYAGRYLKRIAQTGWGMAKGIAGYVGREGYKLLTGDIPGFVDDHLRALYRVYEGLEKLSQYAGVLSTDRCERQRFRDALANYFSNPEAYADMAFFIDSLLAGKLAGDVMAARAEAAVLRRAAAAEVEAVASAELAAARGMGFDSVAAYRQAWAEGVAAETTAAERAVIGEAAAESGTALFRAVGPAELADIQANNLLRNLGSAEGKYFTTSAEAASSYAKQAVKGFGDPPYTIIQTRVPNSIFEGLTPATVDRGIPAWVIPNNRLPGLTPQVLDSMSIPRHP